MDTDIQQHSETNRESGVLYIVSTPIGNLEDISLRAIKILSQVDMIAAEDTRKTKFLLDHYNIHKQLISYYSYNEERRVPELMKKLKEGISIAVVSDAGTPGISDPAYRLIKSAIEEDILVEAIPGASAILPALIVSGLPMKQFIFEGFLPVKKGRKTLLEKLKQEQETIVFYESPYRLLKTLQDIKTIIGNRKISVCRELTKIFEEVVRGSVDEVITHFSKHRIKGEIVLVVAGSADKEKVE
ncbi:MAG: 16S rRNA (cytidine(1402)-2'-O)-methyltransferase [Ignavibacteriae bacterium]|nr:16S rRNA (cytidine(1402)-2'-O)-methyltransferase [Ignavibacteriota bacterium]